MPCLGEPLNETNSGKSDQASPLGGGGGGVDCTALAAHLWQGTTAGHQPLRSQGHQCQSVMAFVSFDVQVMPRVPDAVSEVNKARQEPAPVQHGGGSAPGARRLHEPAWLRRVSGIGMQGTGHNCAAMTATVPRSGLSDTGPQVIWVLGQAGDPLPPPPPRALAGSHDTPPPATTRQQLACFIALGAGGGGGGGRRIECCRCLAPH